MATKKDDSGGFSLAAFLGPIEETMLKAAEPIAKKGVDAVFSKMPELAPFKGIALSMLAVAEDFAESKIHPHAAAVAVATAVSDKAAAAKQS